MPSPRPGEWRHTGSTHRLLGSVVLACALALACGEPQPPELETLETPPTPDLSAVEASVQQQLSEARARLDERQASGAEAAELAREFGRMGQLYHAYDLLPPAAACYRNALILEPQQPQWLYHLAGVYQRQGQLDASVELLNEALTKAPGNAPVHLRLGRVELARSRPTEARAHFEAALRADPACGAARYGLGEAARAAGDLEGAAEHFRQTLEDQPYAEQVLYPLGQTLLRLGQQEEGQQYLDRSAARRISVGGRPTCGDPWDEELSGLTRSAAAHLTRGLHATYNGRLDDALEEYRKALALAPEDPVVHQSLGSAYVASKQLEKALEHYREAVRLAPSDPGLAHDLGIVASQLGRLDDARESLEKALELQPGLQPARLRLAAIEQRAGRHERAIQLFDQTLAADPSIPRARMQRAISLLQLGRRGEAIEEVGRVVDDEPPTDPTERLQLAMLLATLGDLPRADRHFQAVLALDAPASIHAMTHLRMGQLRILTGDRAGAIASLQSALELQPGLQEAEAALARLQ
ncbi:MAG: tetratricopeptide repeat protein [Acidobacteriota bacterium]